MNKTEKMNDILKNVKNGDIILYRGNGFMAKCIRFFDSAYYTHIGVAWLPEKTDQILTLDMWSLGLSCLPLQRRLSIYDDFCILRPNVSTEKIDETLRTLLNNWDGADVKYDYMLLFKIAFKKKTGISLGLGEGKKFICSEFAQQYTNLLGLESYKERQLITPEDFIRYRDPNESEVLFGK